MEPLNKRSNSSRSPSFSGLASGVTMAVAATGRVTTRRGFGRRVGGGDGSPGWSGLQCVRNAATRCEHPERNAPRTSHSTKWLQILHDMNHSPCTQAHAMDRAREKRKKARVHRRYTQRKGGTCTDIRTGSYPRRGRLSPSSLLPSSMASTARAPREPAPRKNVAGLGYALNKDKLVGPSTAMRQIAFPADTPIDDVCAYVHCVLFATTRSRTAATQSSR